MTNRSGRSPATLDGVRGVQLGSVLVVAAAADYRRELVEGLLSLGWELRREITHLR